MKKDELIKQVERTLGKTKVLSLATIASECGASVKDLIDLSFHQDKVVAFRISWILESVFFQFQPCFMDHLNYFVDKYPLQNNDSCRRHFTKIMMEISLFEATDPSRDWTAVIESTFKWLTEPKAPVAVQANCLDILYNLKEKDDWIAEELRFQTEFILRDGTAAIQSRGKRVLAQLNKAPRR
jgi:hypothetical protein